MTDEGVSPVYAAFVARMRRARRFPTTVEPLAAGAAGEPIHVDPKEVDRLLVEAARRASGLLEPTRRQEVVWFAAGSELAIGVGGVHAQLGPGVVIVTIPVRCDEAGTADVHVTFAVGDPDRPAGLYAATESRPRGPALVVDTWGDSLVAFAWQVLVGMVAGVAGATGADDQGDPFVPAELAANPDGLFVVPMARHRLGGPVIGTRG